MVDEKAKQETQNKCCANCLKWGQFGERCWVFWEGKKECSQRVESQDEWDYEKLVIRND